MFDWVWLGSAQNRNLLFDGTFRQWFQKGEFGLGARSHHSIEHIEKQKFPAHLHNPNKSSQRNNRTASMWKCTGCSENVSSLAFLKLYEIFFLSKSWISTNASVDLWIQKGSRSNGFDLNNRNTVFSTVPFFKDHLKQQIELAGGTVYSNFENVPVNKYRSCFLLSPFPCITAKYVQCLAANITVSSSNGFVAFFLPKKNPDRILCRKWILPYLYTIEYEKFPLGCVTRMDCRELSS